MKYRILFPILALIVLSACGTLGVEIEQPTSTAALVFATPVATAAATPALPLPTAPQVVSATPAPQATAAALATSLPAPAAGNTASPNPTPASFIDDRSSASQVIVSLFNAINRQEYARAYGYWTNPASTLGNFAAYANGYQDTASVTLVFGQITGDAGAGQIYYSVPVILKTTAKNGSLANYAACYVVHQAQPGNFGEPPFQPMSIDQGAAKLSDLNASDTSALTGACSDFPSGGNPVAVSGSNLNIDKNNFLDNRSGPLETVSSLFNALNLKQYVRAYSYFQTPATFPGPFDPYAAGYAATESITASFGAVQSEGAAGSLYYKLPVVMQVLNTSAATQTFAGCYTLRLAQPALQSAPPFQPLGITGANFNLVANGADVNSLLPTACN